MDHAPAAAAAEFRRFIGTVGIRAEGNEFIEAGTDVSNRFAPNWRGVRAEPPHKRLPLSGRSLICWSFHASAMKRS